MSGGGSRTGSRTGLIRSAQVEEVAGKAGQDNAGQGPRQGRRPEASGQDEEHVGKVNGVVRGAEETNGGNGKGVAVGENFGSNEEELKGRDDKQDARDGTKSLAGRVGSLGDASVLVDGRNALAQGDGRTVKGIGDISRSSWQGDASRDLGEAASRRSNQSGGDTSFVASGGRRVDQQAL